MADYLRLGYSFNDNSRLNKNIMIALISPAKTMRNNVTIITPKAVCSEPRFVEHTRHIASLMLRYSSVELVEIFKVSAQIARELKYLFARFFDEDENTHAAIDCYDGVVYKHFKGDVELLESQRLYLQDHVRISSLLYGLLRPFDLIKPYRMEGFVRLAGSDERVDHYWRNIQTDTLIDDVNRDNGILLYLAAKDEQKAFNWKEVEKSVRVIHFQFLQYKGDKLKQVVVYTKMARGEMVRYMMDNNITNPEELKTFEWGGYLYNDTLSTDNVWVWVMD